MHPLTLFDEVLLTIFSKPRQTSRGVQRFLSGPPIVRPLFFMSLSAFQTIVSDNHIYYELFLAFMT